ncbi:cell division protein SepF [Sporolactobacillus sp. Y61]|jgi:cell division inhibitor SepF|uniref:Cell division protein SepF n=1 Tax=Sporolactobacillus sp. Y61 TaxID=3160863 RepID=A0AAU8ICR7_9BACL|nr:cell division protein SepF [Sporolactobacillus sp. THM19-2]RYL92884.1 DUF552 domain-containing protein [Sporolactobacillus sp. THM19-2]
MGLKTTLRRFFDLEDVEDPSGEELHDKEAEWPVRDERRSFEKGGRLITLQNVHRQEKVVLVEPKSFDEVQDIVAHLKNRRTVICSLQTVNKSEGQRILDFMSGTCYALNGQIRKIGKDTFLFAPEYIDISGFISSRSESNNHSEVKR